MEGKITDEQMLRYIQEKDAALDGLSLMATTLLLALSDMERAPAVGGDRGMAEIKKKFVSDHQNDLRQIEQRYKKLTAKRS